jgi:hypothetical protein
MPMSPALLDEAHKLKGTAREQSKRWLMIVFLIMLVTRRGVVREMEKMLMEPWSGARKTC